MKLLLAFVFLIVLGTVWETRRERAPRPLPLLIVCTGIAFAFFTVVRFL